jgi:HD-GYP domain-containing protein (c-di-GMP phosphodiesterase class II)
MVYDPEVSSMTAIPDHVEQDNKSRLSMVFEISRRVGQVPRLAQMLEQVIKMTQKTLRTAAASILLYRDNDQDLYFEAASGPVGKALRHVKLDNQYGIAGQVARTGQPLIVNDVTRSERFHKMIDDTTGFSTKSLICAPLTIHRRIIGVIEVLNKLDDTEFDEQDLEAVSSVASTAAVAIENTRMHQTVLAAYKGTIRALTAAIDAKDPATRGHSQRVMEYSMLASTYLSFSPEEIETLEYASILHDIGKISIDSSILMKPEPLSPEEWKIVREHPIEGANMLREIPFLEKASELVLFHHEKYNGEGYPRGLKGEFIPIGARIISVADSFDTMTTNRPYRQAMTFEDSINELRRCVGTQFCPVAVKAFLSGLHLHTSQKSIPIIQGTDLK